jgi:hypothetical protein
MTGSGLQTHDFLMRLKKFEEALPPLLLELAQVMRRLVEEIERPQLEDVQQLHVDLRRVIGGKANLAAVCGKEGKLCPQCPFGAYLPTGFPYASEEKPICLPWIAEIHPEVVRVRGDS